jgi:glyoxylase-like metal-dependent hydrolase (beta-lactamase superfamily II)
MAAIPFLTDFDPRRGECIEVAPGLRRVVADNPSKFTAWGTGTYIVGRGNVAVIDPGPDLDDHVEAVLGAIDGETVTHLLITHTHADHSPAAAALQAATGAPTHGFGPHPAGADTGSEEHGDTAFVPDVVVADGDVIEGDGFSFECLHTPGHISNHVCYAESATGALFTGDHVMGWSTTVISPPDGRIADYLANLRRLLDRDDATYYPTHGPPIDDPRPYVAALVEHRLDRERQIVGQLADGPRTIEEVVAVLYADVRPELHEPAGRSVHAHLIALQEAGRVAAADGDRWALQPPR